MSAPDTTYDEADMSAPPPAPPAPEILKKMARRYDEWKQKQAEKWRASRERAQERRGQRREERASRRLYRQQKEEEGLGRERGRQAAEDFRGSVAPRVRQGLHRWTKFLFFFVILPISVVLIVTSYTDLTAREAIYQRYDFVKEQFRGLSSEIKFLDYLTPTGFQRWLKGVGTFTNPDYVAPESHGIVISEFAPSQEPVYAGRQLAMRASAFLSKDDVEAFKWDHSLVTFECALEKRDRTEDETTVVSTDAFFTTEKKTDTNAVQLIPGNILINNQPIDSFGLVGVLPVSATGDLSADLACLIPSDALTVPSGYSDITYPVHLFWGYRDFTTLTSARVYLLDKEALLRADAQRLDPLEDYKREGVYLNNDGKPRARCERGCGLTDLFLDIGVHTPVTQDSFITVRVGLIDLVGLKGHAEKIKELRLRVPDGLVLAHNAELFPDGPCLGQEGRVQDNELIWGQEHQTLRYLNAALSNESLKLETPSSSRYSVLAISCAFQADPSAVAVSSDGLGLFGNQPSPATFVASATLDYQGKPVTRIVDVENPPKLSDTFSIPTSPPVGV